MLSFDTTRCTGNGCVYRETCARYCQIKRDPPDRMFSYIESCAGEGGYRLYVRAMSEPQVTRRGFLDMQVCVPRAYTDAQVREFADVENPSGTTGGWQVRKHGDPALSGCGERVQCEKRADCVHLMLDA